nr:hypothetical protein [Tanacetum cinerariifolium]
MDLYYFWLTQDDLNELIIRYKIPRDLHPRLPSKEFVMYNLPNDVISVYHRIFDFSGVRIPFFSFLLALIKHYKVHFSQLGPLGLNKVVTFEHRAPSSLCIDDNRSYMKHWKSGFFLIDRRATPDYMSWTHPNSAIGDPKPPANSFNMEVVHRLSTHVVKLRDTPEGVLVLSGLSHVWKSQTCDLVLKGADGNVIWDLAAGNPSAKVVAKAEASQKRKASTFGVTSSYVSKRIIFLRKGIITDAAIALSVSASHPRPSSIPASSFRDISGDAIHRDFFPFSFGPYNATYPKGGVAGNYEFDHEEWNASHQPTLSVLTKEV